MIEIITLEDLLKKHRVDCQEIDDDDGNYLEYRVKVNSEEDFINICHEIAEATNKSE